MKKIYFSLGIIIMPLFILAQAPQGFNYQAVYRDVSGNPISNENVTLIISILQGSVDGTEVFSETHIGSTNEFGLLTITIGSINTTDFPIINWSSGPYFIETNINGNPMGVTQLLSVPFALYAKTAESANIAGTESVFDKWDINKDDDVLIMGNQYIQGHKIFQDSIWIAGIGLPYTFGPDTRYIGDKGAYIGFGHSGISEDFIGYKNNTIYFKDSPGGGDVTDPDVIFGGKIGIGIETPIEKLEVDGNIDLHNHVVKNLAEPVNEHDAATKAYVDDNASATADGSETKVTAGTNVIVTGTGTTANPYVVNATAGGGGFTHYIGELYGGGIIVSVWKVNGVEHGLIAALTEQGINIIWTTTAYQSTNVLPPGATSPIDGLANSNAIVAQAGAGTTYAAGLCRAYSATGDGGLNDWYLPAAWELNQCYNAAFVVNTILGATYGFQFNDYWSSTEAYPYASAWSQSFAHSGTTNGSKGGTYRVRAVRRF